MHIYRRGWDENSNNTINELPSPLSDFHVGPLAINFSAAVQGGWVGAAEAWEVGSIDTAGVEDGLSVA